MVNYLYLATVLCSSAAMFLIDWRWQLFWFRAPLRAAFIQLLMLVFFLVWDGFGISLGVFFRGQSPFFIGLEVAPELPIEELFFLFFLTQFTMILGLSLRRIGGEE